MCAPGVRKKGAIEVAVWSDWMGRPGHISIARPISGCQRPTKMIQWTIFFDHWSCLGGPKSWLFRRSLSHRWWISRKPFVTNEYGGISLQKWGYNSHMLGFWMSCHVLPIVFAGESLQITSKSLSKVNWTPLQWRDFPQRLRKNAETPQVSMAFCHVLFVDRTARWTRCLWCSWCPAESSYFFKRHQVLMSHDGHSTKLLTYTTRYSSRIDGTLEYSHMIIFFKNTYCRSLQMRFTLVSFFGMLWTPRHPGALR